MLGSPKPKPPPLPQTADMPRHPQWICCQIGAREHYAIPRALQQAQQLNCLITDAWVPPSSPLNKLPHTKLRSLRDRIHPDLTHAPVQRFTLDALRFEFLQRLKGTTSWERIIARNNWFQRRAISALQHVEPETPITLFAYSYAAKDIFRYAKSQGWTTVLGQIDPGPVEETIVLAEQARYPGYEPAWQPAPKRYWQSWKEECTMADHILVNSNWSQQVLEQASISKDKITVVPLAYDKPSHSINRTYPDTFSSHRPLRVLFLGQIILRKGIAALLDAAQKLKDEPVEFWMVGAQGVQSPHPPDNIRWIGPVPRSATAHYYQQADVFLSLPCQTALVSPNSKHKPGSFPSLRPDTAVQ